MLGVTTGFARVSGLGYILACGPDYGACSAFDCNGECNPIAMVTVADMSG